MNNSALLIFILLIPFISALAVMPFRPRSRRIVFALSLSSLICGVLLSCYTFAVLPFGEKIIYHLGGWEPPYGISLSLNHYSLAVIIAIYLTGLSNVMTYGTVLNRVAEVTRPYYTLSMLLLTGFIGLCMTMDIFNVYVFLEITSIVSYALIGRGDGRACRASFNYLIIGTVAASFYLIGVGFLYIKTGTLSVESLQSALPYIYSSVTIAVAFVFMLLGLMMKVAIFPMHFWLPNAYTYCPQPSVALLAPLSTKISLLLLLRVVLEVFGYDYVIQYENLKSFFINLTAIGICVLSFMAIAQKSRIKSLAYIITIEIAYIFSGIYLLNKDGLIAASYHIICDIFLTAAVVFFIGAVRVYFNKFNSATLAGVFRRLPVVGLGFMITGLCLIGVPPTGGFVTKFYLISAAYQEQQWFLIFTLLVSSLTVVFVFFKIVERGFYAAPEVEEIPVLRSTKFLINLTAIMLAAILLLLGIYQADILNYVILPFIESKI